MMFLDKLFDVWSNRRSIEAHHEQLTLCETPLAIPHAALPWQRPTIALHHGNVSRAISHIAQSVHESSCGAYLSRLSQTGSTFSVLAMMTMRAAPEAGRDHAIDPRA
jgi:hypothetical protein